MAYKKKTWKEKLYDNKDLPKVEKIKKPQEKKWGKGTIAIPSPLEVDEIMRKIPLGKVITLNQIRNRIAKKHRATMGCPITTGIFSWIAAHAAEEMRAAGEKNITPWWRTLKGEGFLSEKFPGGTELQKKLLQKEGHKIIEHGRKLFVEDVLETQVK
jgi:alkylated DNA nucleotide flippase Atl1